MRVALAILLLLVACGASEEPKTPTVVSNGRTLLIYTVNDPLRTFAARIGGADADVRFPAGREVVDPATFRPDPETVAAYQGADLVILNGGGYAKWIQQVSLRDARLLDTSAAFADRTIPLTEAVTHGHGPKGEHVHAGVATTFWLDLDLARAQAQAIAERFARERPAGASGFRARHAELDAELAALDEQIRLATDCLAGAPVLFSHPVYSYLERRYGLNGRSLHWEPHEAPNEAMWQELRVLLGSHPARTMLWEAEPLRETSDRLGKLGIDVVVYEPAGGRAREGDFLTRMHANAERLAGCDER